MPVKGQVCVHLCYLLGCRLNFVYYFFTQDIKKLAADIPGLAGLYMTPAETFNHLDIMYDEAAADLVYKRLIEHDMEKYR